MISTSITVADEAELRRLETCVDRDLAFPDGTIRTVQLKTVEWETYDALLSAGMTAIELNSVPFEEACKLYNGFYGPRTNSFAGELMLCMIQTLQALWPSLPSRNRRPANFLADASYHREQGCTRLMVVPDSSEG